MNRGYVRVWRKMEDSGILDNAEMCRMFLYLLLKAASRPRRQMIGTSLVPLAAGQLVTGRKRLAEDLGISEAKARATLRALCKTGVIDQRATNKYSIITLANWGKYQHTPAPDNRQSTGNPPTENRQPATNKNEEIIIHTSPIPYTPDRAPCIAGGGHGGDTHGNNLCDSGTCDDCAPGGDVLDKNPCVGSISDKAAHDDSTPDGEARRGGCGGEALDDGAFDKNTCNSDVLGSIAPDGGSPGEAPGGEKPGGDDSAVTMRNGVATSGGGVPGGARGGVFPGSVMGGKSVENAPEEFRKLREYYDKCGRREAPGTGLAEYWQCRAARTWPGLDVMLRAVGKLASADDSWQRGYAPGLARFLRERQWLKPPTPARFPPSGGGPLRPATDGDSAIRNNLNTAARVLAGRYGGQ